jgi:hypothetical protein
MLLPGCSTDLTPNGLDVGVLSFYAGDRYLEMWRSARDQTPSDYFEVADGIDDDIIITGTFFNCTTDESNEDEYLRVALRDLDPRTNPQSKVFTIKTWSDLECRNRYTLVIGEENQLTLYLGEQYTPPFKDPVPADGET